MTNVTSLPIVAKTVHGIVHGTDPVAARIRDRGVPMTQTFVDNILSTLLIGYPGRRPRKQKDAKGRARPTDMDLASFLVHLMQKPTILELPKYTAALPRTVRVNERQVNEQRFGKLIGLSSHREHLSFGVTIEDMSIAKRSDQEEDTVGAVRTFLVMSHEGVWHTGWQGLTWSFRRDEQNFRDRYELSNDTLHIGYQYFVHPNRRHSIFSRAHLLLKLLWSRLEDEIKSLEKVDRNTAGLPNAITACTTGKHQMVPVFTMKLSGLPLYGTYSKDTARVPLLELQQMRMRVQFLVRLNEYAFYRYGREKDYVANWIRNSVWHHHISSDAYHRHSSLLLAPGVTLQYTVDTVSKRVAH